MCIEKFMHRSVQNFWTWCYKERRVCIFWGDSIDGPGRAGPGRAGPGWASYSPGQDGLGWAGLSIHQAGLGRADIFMTSMGRAGPDRAEVLSGRAGNFRPMQSTSGDVRHHVTACAYWRWANNAFADIDICAPIHPLNAVRKSDLVQLHYQKITYIWFAPMRCRYIKNTICKSSIRDYNDNIDVGDSYCGRRIWNCSQALERYQFECSTFSDR